MSHTPGPWLAASRPSSIVGWPVVAKDGRSIASVSYLETPRTPYNEMQDEAEANYRAECKANAVLIAAAPDLLEALEGIVNPLRGFNAHVITRDDVTVDVSMSMKEVREIISLIAKAKGE